MKNIEISSIFYFLKMILKMLKKKIENQLYIKIYQNNYIGSAI